MALVTKLTRIELEKSSPHSSADCTYSLVVDDGGHRLLQIDTYGSSRRKVKGKKSQSIRFSPEAIKQLKQIIDSML